MAMSARSTAVRPTAEPKRSPRERLLEAASELFYAEGIQSVGIDRVIERAGVAKASLYSTFGSKEELVRAYLDERHAKLLAWRRAAAAAVDDPVEKILAVFDSAAGIRPTGLQRLCLRRGDGRVAGRWPRGRGLAVLPRGHPRTV